MKWQEYILMKVKNRLDIQHNEKTDVLEDLIHESLVDIVDNRNLNKYSSKYDTYLIKCVVRKYNKLGVEGVITRSNGSVRTEYGTANEIQDILDSIPYNITAVGKTFGEDRYDYPSGDYQL